LNEEDIKGLAGWAARLDGLAGESRTGIGEKELGDIFSAVSGIDSLLDNFGRSRGKSIP